MRKAEVGWAYLGEDPSVNALERRGAERLGKEAAALVPTCSAANLVALMSLGARGAQLVVDPTAHVVTSESRGFESVCGLVGRFVEARDGCPDPDDVERAIADGRRAGLDTAVVCLENSHNNAGGVAVGADRMDAVSAVAHRHGASVHLDGARLFNAAAALGVPAARLARSADTVSLSLGKGLSAPGGALLAGTRAVIERARSHCRTIGAASLHKAGVVAAAGLVALESMVERLAEDNARARRLAVGLSAMSPLRVDLGAVQTNIVLVDTPPGKLTADELLQRLAARGVLGFRRSESRIRFVTYRLIGDAEVSRALDAVAASL